MQANPPNNPRQTGNDDAIFTAVLAIAAIAGTGIGAGFAIWQ